MSLSSIIANVGPVNTFRALKGTLNLSPGVTGLIETLIESYEGGSTNMASMKKEIQAAVDKLTAKDRESVLKAIAPSCAFLLSQYADGTIHELLGLEPEKKSSKKKTTKKKGK